MIPKMILIHASMFSNFRSDIKERDGMCTQQDPKITATRLATTTKSIPSVDSNRKCSLCLFIDLDSVIQHADLSFLGCNLPLDQCNISLCFIDTSLNILLLLRHA